MAKRWAIRIGLGAVLAAGLVLAAGWDAWFEKRVLAVRPGAIVRGAWQAPGPLRRLIAREKIRTIVTLTAINRDDPKYVAQERVVRASGVRWIVIPMRGSRATLEQMAQAADLIADRNRQPVFFHCVAGHHRTSLVHAAYLIRYQGYSAEQAWRAVAALPWARPGSAPDQNDRRLIEAYAAASHSIAPTASFVESDDAHGPTGPVDGSLSGRGGLDSGRGSGLADGVGQFRHHRAGPDLPLGAARRAHLEPGGS